MSTIQAIQAVQKELQEIKQLTQQLAKQLARGTQLNVRPFFVGDETTTEVLKDAVARAIKTRGMTLQEISDETGARRNRVSGAIVKLQHDGVKVINEGNGYRAIWRVK